MHCTRPSESGTDTTMSTTSRTLSTHRTTVATREQSQIGAHPQSLDPAADFAADLPTVEDSATGEPDLLDPADAQTVRRIHRTAGVGPHLDQLNDEERSALMAHLARVDAAIARHRAGTPVDDDWPFYVDTMADSLEAYEYRGTTSHRGDDPVEYDYTILSDHAADLLEGVKTAWIERAEAYSARRPL